MTRLTLVADRVDPVPADVLNAARAALSMRDLDAQLALLMADSEVSEGPVLVRDTQTLTPRMLSFGHPSSGVELELEIHPSSDGVRLLGLVTGSDGPLTVECDDTNIETTPDALGRFTVANVPHGQLRLRVAAPDGTRVVTSRVTV